MARPPLLHTGAAAQYPLTRTLEARSRVLRFSDGREQRFPTVFGVRRKWKMNLSMLSDSEEAAIERFVEQQGGRGEVFEFVDPFDGSLVTRCRLESNLYTTASEGISRNSTTLEIAEEPEA